MLPTNTESVSQAQRADANSSLIVWPSDVAADANNDRSPRSQSTSNSLNQYLGQEAQSRSRLKQQVTDVANQGQQAGGAFGPFLATWIAIAGMVSALALFNALLLSFSRIPMVMAVDGLLPSALMRTDARGTPRNAVLFAALCYSAFMLLPFSGLVVADVLLYSLALMLEFASLIQLRRREPELRGAFRIPLGTRGVAALAALPLAVLGLVIALSIQDGEYGLPALIGATVAIALGPATYAIARRMRLPAELT